MRTRGSGIIKELAKDVIVYFSALRLLYGSSPIICFVLLINPEYEFFILIDSIDIYPASFIFAKMNENSWASEILGEVPS